MFLLVLRHFQGHDEYAEKYIILVPMWIQNLKLLYCTNDKSKTIYEVRALQFCSQNSTRVVTPNCLTSSTRFRNVRLCLYSVNGSNLQRGLIVLVYIFVNVLIENLKMTQYRSKHVVVNKTDSVHIT